jgi:DNA-directed RNA polymerase subunit RPC12/RpoP
MQLNYFTYREEVIRCPHCGWQGLGAELQYGEFHEGSYIADKDCPACGGTVGFTQAPLLTEIEEWKKRNPGKKVP